MNSIDYKILDPKAPIGVFDSGLGGLMVLQEISSALPEENFIYVGDEDNFPYGEKSIDLIQSRCLKIGNWLVEQGVKVIVIACNTATAAALDVLQNTMPVPVFGVVQAGVMSAYESTKNNSIGILATSATIGLGVYQKNLLTLNPRLKIVSVAAPKLVDYVQNNLDQILFDPTEQMIKDVKDYTKKFHDEDCDTILLGCTHFPALTPVFERELGNSVNFVSPSKKTASELAKFLSDKSLLNGSESSYSFYTTGKDVKGLKKFWARPGSFHTLCV